MDYGNLLKRGWSITWNNKWLWILGFIAALGGSGGSGGGGGGNTGFNGGSGTSSSDFDFEQWGEFEQFARMLESGEVWASIGAIVFLLVCCLVLFFFVMWFVRLVAEAGMIQAVTDIEDGIKTNFQKAFGGGSQHLGSLFVVNLILWAIPAIVGLCFAGLSIFSGLNIVENGNPESMGLVLACLIPMLCLLIPYSILVSFLYPIAQRGVVLRGMGPMDSISHAWAFLKANFGEVFLIGIIFLAVGIGFGIITAIVVLPIIVAAGAPAAFAFMNSGGAIPSANLIALAVFGVIAAMIAGSIVNSVMITFRSATFTLAYRELSNKGSDMAAPADPFEMG